jgi:methylase of polypeptide subunit release factors
MQHARREAVHRRLGLPGTAEARDIATAHRAHVAAQTVAAVFDVDGLSIHAPAGVYHPAEGSSTRFFIAALAELSVPDAAPLLEIGTGTGAIAMAMAARFDRPVEACDISEASVAAARENVARNADRLRRPVTVTTGDLFSACHGRRHGLVVFNNPLIDAPFDAAIDRQSLSDPGGGILSRFLGACGDHLVEGGVALFGLCSNTAFEVLDDHAHAYRVVRAEIFDDGFWRAVVAATR